ncbi:MAG: zinc ribbon domain-containing protein [Proteobacteria bacterium]|nr:zinc ribbon domain-containing protein [Pseudomonadota bacterium]
MPIYAYRCSACGHAKDVLQKLSDPVLTTCPACGAEAFAKQVTAAGFQLKGSGWYVTDFRGGNNAAKKDDAKDGAKDGQADGKPADGAAAPAAPAATAADGKAAPAPAPAAASPAAAPAPAPASGGSSSGSGA